MNRILTYISFAGFMTFMILMQYMVYINKTPFAIIFGFISTDFLVLACAIKLSRYINKED